LKNNEFIPHETLEQFLAKNTQFRPAKKLTFDDKPGTREKRQLLTDHLSMVENNANMRLTNRQSRLDEEREEAENIQNDLKNHAETSH
jgi:hypothetical protein